MKKKNVIPYVLVRSASAGTFAGYLKARKGQEVKLEKARRLLYWTGAPSISHLAQYGTNKPSECKFPSPVDSVILSEVIEIIPMNNKSRKSIERVPISED
jgi:hypothetical protein